MRFISFFTLFLLPLTLISCSNTPETQTKSASAEKAPTQKAKKTPTSSLMPCELLTLEMVMADFQIAQDKITQEPYRKTMCSYRWEKPNAEEIDQRNEKLMDEHLSKQLKATQQGQTLKRPAMEDSYARLSLTTVDMKDASRAGVAFDNMIKSISEGISAEKDGVKAKFRMVYDQTIEGIGDQAAWSSKSKQLSFRKGALFLHVQVDVSPKAEENLAQAKFFAEKILAKL